MTVIKLARLPDRVHTLDEMFGAVKQIDGMVSIIVLVEDGSGVVTMTLDGTTAERMNWMLDRAKILLHVPLYDVRSDLVTYT
jgi:hypothetical protein